MPQEQGDSKPSKEVKKSLSVKKIILISGILGGILVFITVLILLLLAPSLFFFLGYKDVNSLLKNPSTAGQQEVDTLVKKVSKHYDLPTNDQVTVATVSDINKLKGQTFFVKAQNGDKVLIYPKSGIAILYRPTTDKIINVGPVNTQGDTAEPTVQAQTSAPVKVALYNGTKTNGLTKKVEQTLLTLSSMKTTVVTKANAANDYADSVVVDLTGKNQAAATQLAVFAKGKVASLPAGETKPDGADILIILRSSYAGAQTVTSAPTPTPAP